MKAKKKALKKYKGGGKVHTDELGRRGHFNPFTKKTKGAKSGHAPYDSEYSKDYQNKVVGAPAKKIGHNEEKLRSGFKRDTILGLRAEAYKNRQNKFGVKKPKLK